MRTRKFPCVVLAVVMLLLLTGCVYEGNFTGSSSDGSDISSGSSPVIKEDLFTIDDLHLRDKKLLYENQDPADVVTMYLTVSTGNSAENTSMQNNFTLNVSSGAVQINSLDSNPQEIGDSVKTALSEVFDDFILKRGYTNSGNR